MDRFPAIHHEKLEKEEMKEVKEEESVMNVEWVIMLR
jgi:hypothetical protein